MYNLYSYLNCLIYFVTKTFVLHQRPLYHKCCIPILLFNSLVNSSGPSGPIRLYKCVYTHTHTHKHTHTVFISLYYCYIIIIYHIILCSTHTYIHKHTHTHAHAHTHTYHVHAHTYICYNNFTEKLKKTLYKQTYKIINLCCFFFYYSSIY